MTKYPNQIDDDSSLPRADDGITELNAFIINAVREAVFSLEMTLGINPQGSTNSVENRLSVSLDPTGNIIPSALTGIGLVTLPITNDQISPSAAIQETKLDLFYPTTTLYNLYIALKSSVDVLNGFLSLTGIKLEPHIDGTNYNHLLTAIKVDPSIQFLDRNSAARNTTNSETLLSAINTDLVSHEKSDGTSIGTIPPNNFGHVSTGIFLNSSNFATIPTTTNNVQSFAEFVDSSSLFLLGSRTQNLYSNGVSRTSRSIVFNSNDGYFSGVFGQVVVPPTLATAYLTNNSSNPVDDINDGDDIVLFTPTSNVLSNNIFDSQFALVVSGDILTINYGSVITSFVIDSVKAIFTDLAKTYAVRINGNNLAETTTAIAKITKPLFNRNKYGVLATAAANNNITNAYGSLIVANPRSAIVLGLNFNPNNFDENHYNLYLTLYPTGNPSDKVVQLSPIDITGNKGTTPGEYTLDNIISATNTVFRQPGFNYRFIAYSYQGEFGIMLADQFNNASFSIISGSTDGYGNYTATSNSSFPANVVDIFNNIDPLGFGANNANVASPPYTVSYSSPYAAQVPTIIFPPLKKNFYYVNGSEKDVLKQEELVSFDIYGDGYWPATIISKQVFSNRVQVSYLVNLDLNAAGLKIGKTIVVQNQVAISSSQYSSVDYGRFIISNISFTTPCGTSNGTTTITVYDGIHGTGISPFVSSVNIPVNLYFSDDSVSFDAGNVEDTNSLTPYKRYFEVYVDGTSSNSGHTATHERARFLYTGTPITNINFYNISPKFAGYRNAQSNASPNVIRLTLSYNNISGIYDGYLSKNDFTNQGNIYSGKIGEITRFYDNTNIDFIDFTFDINQVISSFSNQILDIDIFPSLVLDEELMPIGSCQVNDLTKIVNYVKDDRQFGNISEEQLSDSAIDFVQSGDRYLHQNGVLSGFSITNITNNTITITGGIAFVNGKILNVNNNIINVPLIQEIYLSTIYEKINYLLCVNEKSEFVLIALTDFDSFSPATPNAPNRILSAINPLNSSIYNIESRKFIDVINVRKDLTILYKISSVVSNTGTIISLSESDARRFSFQTDANIFPVLTDSNVQGNFYSFDSLISWAQVNSKYYSNIEIKGNFITSASYNFSPTNIVNINGNQESAITFNSNSSFSNVNFIGFTFTINVAIDFVNCNFTNCNFILNDSMELNTTTTFSNTTITANVSPAIIINSDDIYFKYCNFINNFDPTNPPDGYYDPSDLFNAESGLIYVQNNTTFQFDTLNITNCEFITNTINHYPFISVQFNFIDSVYQNILIRNNRFYSNTGSQASPIDDTRAVITFSYNISDPFTSIEGPRLINAFVEENICDKNQIIAIITIADNTNHVTGALSTINCIISSNTCGQIIYFNRYETPRNFPSYNNIPRTFQSLLYINNNVCQNISTQSGFIHLFVETGKVIISNNSLSFVSINITSDLSLSEEARSILEILNNTFNANYNTTLFAIKISRSGNLSYAGSIIISKNIIDVGTAVAADGITKTIYYYSAGYITSTASATITDNIMRGIGNSSSSPINHSLLALIGNFIITGNSIYRGAFDLGTGFYINGQSGHFNITDNFFDSSTVDIAGTNEQLITIDASSQADYERNINQIGYKAIPFVSGESTLLDGINFINQNSGNYTVSLFPFYNSAQSPVYLYITTAETGQHTYRKVLDIGNVIPNGVQILEAKIGVLTEVSGDTPNNNVSDNTITAALFSSKINSVNYNTGTNSILDPFYGLGGSGGTSAAFSSITYETIVKLDALSTLAQFISVSPSFSSEFNTEFDKSITVTLSWTLNLSAVVFNTVFIISPVVVKYRW